jgi:ribosomal protein S17E
MSSDNVKELYSQETNRLITENKEYTNQVLKEIEKNFRNTIQGHITHHGYLEEEAEKRGDIGAVMYHRTRREVYQQILASYSLSNSYATI